MRSCGFLSIIILLFSTIYVASVYPIVGMWQWGGGYLASGPAGESLLRLERPAGWPASACPTACLRLPGVYGLS